MSAEADRRRVVLGSADHPRYVVWELTLRCDLACRHCGSRAGRPRAEELSLEEARSLVDQLAELGTEAITFIGGEAYLHPDWLGVVQAASQAGIRCTLTTGGRAFTRSMARKAAAAGLAGVSVSIDGIGPTHDTLRAVSGSYDAALRALKATRKAGMLTMANTQFNRLNMGEIDQLADVFASHGVEAWQVQLTGPMGRAAERPEWLLQPYDILELIDRLAAAARRLKADRPDFVINAGNNLGYFGPPEEAIRVAPYPGCQAGVYLLGIESNGDIKGCPSLPSAPYVGGNVRERPLRDIWNEAAELAFVRRRQGRDHLWGFCAGCYYADHCGGGCTWTAHTLLGRPGNMPYCYHRADQLRSEGRRERVELVEAAPGKPFDFGRFALVEEDWPA